MHGRGDSIQGLNVADARRFQWLGRVEDPFAGIRLGERLNCGSHRPQVVTQVDMRCAANRPDLDQLAAGQVGHVDTAVRQRPPRAVRAGVLYPDVQHCCVVELEGVPVQLLGSHTEAEDLRTRDGRGHVLIPRRR
jgi:hypothetical protein